MICRITRLATCLLLSALVLGCGKKGNDRQTASTTRALMPYPSEPKVVELPPNWKPEPVLPIAEPKESAMVGGVDVSKLPVDILIDEARAATEEKEFAKAAIYSYWAARTENGELYDLACNCALAGKKEEAYFWLQRAGITIGVDTERAKKDRDLESLRFDVRWNDFAEWLQRCELYHEKNTKPVTTLIVPAGYDPQKDKPIPVVLWLHGAGSKPQDLVNPGQPNSLARAWADRLRIAFIGVSGTKAKAGNFFWAENPAEDMVRVNAALEEVKGKVVVQPGGLIAFGFSQGAQSGLELAAFYPEVFAGAIVLSPGSDSEHLWRKKTIDPLLKKRGFIFGCGEKEARGNLMQAQTGVFWTRAAGANVMKLSFKGQSAHAFPADIETRFPEWIDFILEADRKP